MADPAVRSPGAGTPAGSGAVDQDRAPAPGATAPPGPGAPVEVAGSAGALRESEPWFRAVFSAIDQGYTLCELVVDGAGRAVDYRFLEVNPVFEQMTGLADAVGRTALELVPGLESHWVEAYARVALGGETIRFEQWSAAMGRWFDVFAMPVQPVGRFVIVFSDTTRRRQVEAALRESEERFRTMADSAPVMIWLTDPDGSCTYLNQRWYDFTGQEPEAAMGLGWLDATHPDDRAATEAAFLRSNDERRAFRAEYRLRRRDGAYRWAIDAAEPRRGPDGEFLGFIGSVIDITERREAEEALRRSEAEERRARQRAELVARIAATLEQVEGARNRAQRLVELLVPEVADFAAVELPGEPSPLAGVTHRDPSKVPVLRALRDRPAEPQDPVWSIVAGRDEVVTTVQFDGRDAVALDPDAARQWRELGLRSFMGVSLDLGGEVRGALLFGLSEPSRPPFTSDDVAFVRSLADHAAVLLGSARVRDEEHRIARRLQEALLPDDLVEHERVEVAARYEAASEVLEVGGDWYDSYLLPDGSVAVAVGDVVGHGLDAAAAMGRLRAGLAALAPRCAGPAEVLEELDRFARGPGATAFATACCAVLDPTTGELRYASAGHPAMLVVAADGSSRWLEGGRSTPLGTLEPAARPEASEVLAPGSLVLLYSDGLVERRREPYRAGVARLQAAAEALADATAAEACDRLVTAMANGAPHEDDVVVLGLRYLPPSTEHFHCSVRAAAGELAGLRAMVRRWATARCLPERQSMDLLIALGEGCANAAEHAYRGSTPGTVEVALHHRPDRALDVEVRDSGRWRPTGHHRSDRGRGTAMMEAVSTGFTRRTGPEGTKVMFRIPAGP